MSIFMGAGNLQLALPGGLLQGMLFSACKLSMLKI
jgi:hypothetical protein